MLAFLRSGAWLTAERRRLVCALLALGAAGILLFVHATAHVLPGYPGLLDYQGRPLGTDFSQVWVAGRSVLAGDPASPYDPVLHWARQKEVFGPEAEFYGWLYPPTFLLPAAGLALLPYWPALLAWMLGTGALYAATLRAILPRRETLLVGLAFPAVFINAGHGNNAFLTAALLGGGLVLLPRRPVVAGILLGLLSYKPQFGLLVPLALAAGSQWRTFSSAAATTLLLALASLAAFGWSPWAGFLDSLAFTRTVVLEQGGAGFHRLQSPFAAVRLLGGDIGAAWLAQYAASATCVAAVGWSWRQPVDARLRAAVLVVASLLATPYLFDYDLVLLAVAGAFFAAYGLDRGFRPWEISGIALAWLAPLFARSFAGSLHLPLGLLSLVLLLGLLLHAARVDQPRWVTASA